MQRTTPPRDHVVMDGWMDGCCGGGDGALIFNFVPKLKTKLVILVVRIFFLAPKGTTYNN